jgi:prepilin-type N-terminal cleavage/methylation domain-containing protein
MKSKGFTLIELLIVIAIISLLSTVVFYSTTEARKKADDSHMKAEASQLSRAIELYKIDNDGKVPSAGVKGQMVREGDTTSENAGEYEAVMQKLVPKYLPEIPTSPSGEAYAYMVSEDETEAVFAASLNYENSFSGNGSNSCGLIQSGDTPTNCSVINTRYLGGSSYCSTFLEENEDKLCFSTSVYGYTPIYSDFCATYNQDGDFDSTICDCSEGDWLNACADKICDEYGGVSGYVSVGENRDNRFIQCRMPIISPGAVICDLPQPVICDGSSNHDHCECI